MSIQLNNINIHYGELQVLKNINMNFREGEISVVLGPSGCGKTTILNLLTAIKKPSSGSVSGIEKLKISYLFQEPRLLPWLTVEGNLKFVLDEIEDTEKRNELITRFLKMTNLYDFRTWYPAGLSGGMKQRAAVARAFAHPSDTILMDEPFQGLDLKLKLSLIDQFISLWKETKRTVVLVTHDLHEAIKLADKIYVLSEKPASIVDSFGIQDTRERRSPGSPLYLDVEKRLYKSLV